MISYISMPFCHSSFCCLRTSNCSGLSREGKELEPGAALGKDVVLELSELELAKLLREGDNPLPESASSPYALWLSWAA
jgi:hypothetical protein